MSYNPYSYVSNEASNGVTDRFSHNDAAMGAQPSIQQVPLQDSQNQAYQQQHQQRQAPPIGQPQGQQQPVGGNGGLPFQDPRNSMAFQFGQTAFSNFIGQDNFNQFQETVSKATGSSSSLGHYFQVSTSYVLYKMKQILVPFLNTNNWQRIPDNQNNNNNSQVSFLAPKDDINSPDLYIPIMGLITYILIWNTQQGLQGSFNPENLYYKLSSILAFVGLDLLILKLGLYLLVNTNSPITSLTELVCYVGYKFVPLTLALFAPKSTMISTIIRVYLFIAFGVFLLRSIKFNLFSTSDEIVGVKYSIVKKCNYFLFVYGFVWQSILMWLMG